MNKYNVYEVPSRICYSGVSLIAGESAEQVNKIIHDFKESDPANNESSWGYENISEEYKIDHLYSDVPGIICKGIYYFG